MEFINDIILFVFAIVAVIINGVPPLIYAESRGFAIKPAGFAFLIGGLGNTFLGSVTPISAQAETITVASISKNLRNNISSLLLAALLMTGVALFGGINWIANFAGDTVIWGMMSGIGLILAGVSWDMLGQEKRITLISIITAVAAYTFFIDNPNRVVWTIFISVLTPTIDYLFFQRRRVNVDNTIEEGREPLQLSNEWRFWKKLYWQEFRLIKPTINATVIMGALSISMLNVGANISFGTITADIAGTTQNFDHLTLVNALSNIPSAIFGGPPIEAIISGTAAAPWPILSGIVFMLVMGFLVLLGLVGRVGRYIPAQSIAGFLLVIGFLLTFVPNLSAVANSDQPLDGFVAMGVTTWSKNPFLGMVVGITMRYLGLFSGLM